MKYIQYMSVFAGMLAFASFSGAADVGGDIIDVGRSIEPIDQQPHDPTDGHGRADPSRIVLLEQQRVAALLKATGVNGGHVPAVSDPRDTGIQSGTKVVSGSGGLTAGEIVKAAPNATLVLGLKPAAIVDPLLTVAPSKNKLAAVLKAIQQAAGPLQVGESFNGSSIIHVLRLFNYMEKFQNDPAVTPGGLKSLDLETEFGQVKTLLNKVIAHQRVLLAQRILGLYGEHESTVTQADSSNFSEFKNKVLDLFKQVHSEELSPEEKELSQIRTLFDFETQIKKLLATTPVTDAVRQQLLAAVRTELGTQLLAQESAAPSSDQLTFGELLTAFAVELGQVKSGTQWNLPHSQAFQSRASSYPQLVEQVASFKKSATQFGQSLSDAVTARGVIADTTSAEYQKADQKVKQATLALKTVLEMVSNADGSLDVLRTEMIDAVAKARDMMAKLQKPNPKIVKLMTILEAQSLTFQNAQIADSLSHGVMDSLRKQVLRQQATDFLSDKSLSDTVDGNFRSDNITDLQRIMEAMVLRDFSLEDAEGLFTAGPAQKQLKQYVAFQQRVAAMLSEPVGTLPQITSDVTAAIGKEGIEGLFNKQVETLEFFIKQYPNFKWDDMRTLSLRLQSEFLAAQAQAQAGVDSGFLEALPGDVFDQGVLSFGKAKTDPFYEQQNTVYQALFKMQEIVLDMGQTVAGFMSFGSNKASYDRTTDLLKNLQMFGYKNVTGTDSSPAVRTIIQELSSPSYAGLSYDERGHAFSLVRDGLSFEIGKRFLNLSGDDKSVRAGDFVVLSSLDAARVKNFVMNMVPSVTPAEYPLDWRYLPKSFLVRLGDSWLAQRSKKLFDQIPCADKSLLCNAWAVALRVVGKSEQPFRNLTTNVFSSPLAEQFYFGGRPEFTFSSAQNDAVVAAREFGLQPGEYGLQNFKGTFISYQGFISGASGNARAADEYLQTIEQGLGVSFGVAGGIELVDLPFIVSDISSFQSALIVGQKPGTTPTWWQSDLIARAQGVKEACMRVVTAQALAQEIATVSDSDSSLEKSLQAIKMSMLQDLSGRLTFVEGILKKLVNSEKGNTLTSAELQQLHIFKATLSLEKSLLNLLDLQKTQGALQGLLEQVTELDTTVVPGGSAYVQQLQKGWVQQVGKNATNFSVDTTTLFSWSGIAKQIAKKSFPENLTAEIARVHSVTTELQGLLSDIDSALALLPEDSNLINGLKKSRTRLQALQQKLTTYESTWSTALQDRTTRVRVAKSMLEVARNQFVTGGISFEAYKKNLMEYADVPEVAAQLENLAALKSVSFVKPTGPNVTSYLKNPVSYLKGALQDTESFFDSKLSAVVQQMGAGRPDDGVAQELQQVQGSITQKMSQLSDLTALTLSAQSTASSESLAFEVNPFNKSVRSPEAIKFFIVSELSPSFVSYPSTITELAWFIELQTRLVQNPAALLQLPREQLLILQQAREGQLNAKRQKTKQLVPEYQQVRDLGHVLKDDLSWALFVQKMSRKSLKLSNAQQSDLQEFLVSECAPTQQKLTEYVTNLTALDTMQSTLRTLQLGYQKVNGSVSDQAGNISETATVSELQAHLQELQNTRATIAEKLKQLALQDQTDNQDIALSDAVQTQYESVQEQVSALEKQLQQQLINRALQEFTDGKMSLEDYRKMLERFPDVPAAARDLYMLSEVSDAQLVIDATKPGVQQFTSDPTQFFASITTAYHARCTSLRAQVLAESIKTSESGQVADQQAAVDADTASYKTSEQLLGRALSICGGLSFEKGADGKPLSADAIKLVMIQMLSPQIVHYEGNITLEPWFSTLQESPAKLLNLSREQLQQLVTARLAFPSLAAEARAKLESFQTVLGEELDWAIFSEYLKSGQVLADSVNTQLALLESQHVLLEADLDLLPKKAPYLVAIRASVIDNSPEKTQLMQLEDITRFTVGLADSSDQSVITVAQNLLQASVLLSDVQGSLARVTTQLQKVQESGYEFDTFKEFTSLKNLEAQLTSMNKELLQSKTSCIEFIMSNFSERIKRVQDILPGATGLQLADAGKAIDGLESDIATVKNLLEGSLDPAQQVLLAELTGYEVQVKKAEIVVTVSKSFLEYQQKVAALEAAPGATARQQVARLELLSAFKPKTASQVQEELSGLPGDQSAIAGDIQAGYQGLATKLQNFAVSWRQQLEQTLSDNSHDIDVRVQAFLKMNSTNTGSLQDKLAVLDALVTTISGYVIDVASGPQGAARMRSLGTELAQKIGVYDVSLQAQITVLGSLRKTLQQAASQAVAPQAKAPGTKSGFLNNLTNRILRKPTTTK